MRLTVCLLTFIFILISCKKKVEDQDKDVSEMVTPVKQVADSVLMIYDIAINKKVQFIDSSEIKKNELFNDFFKGYILDNGALLSATEKTQEIFSFKKMRAGQAYNIIYHQTDSGKRVDYYIYHHLPNKKLIIGFDGIIRAYWHELPVDTVHRTLYANIERTLYHSIIDADISYDLGVKLSEVFAWQVDFFKIDAKDFFKVIFDEYHVDGKAYEIGRIQAAEFYHRGDTFYAFNFKQDSIHSYFDENGKSLRKAFLRAPLKYSRISSKYSKKRFHPVQRRWKAHLGTDYAAPTGTPIRTVGDGVVVEARRSRGNGNYVKVKHSNVYSTQYLHMSKIAKISRVGRTVKQGDIIGYVGSTGLATGPHLCFRFWKNGVQVDPFSIKVPPSIPIDPARKDEFEIYKQKLKEQLNGLALSE